MKNKRKILNIVICACMPVILAFIVGGIFIGISGHNPIAAYMAMFKGALGSKSAILNTLFAATPLIFTGLATAIAFKANIFNMGVEGQLYMGAFAAAYAGFTFKGLPALVHILVCLAFGIIFACLFALIPAVLKAFFKVNEMVVTIMLNYVAILFTTYLASFPFKAEGVGFAATSEIAETAVLPRLADKNQLNFSFIIALIAVVVIYLIYRKTKIGYEVNAIGRNINFSEATGMRTSKKIIYVMLISGALAGLAGAGEILGVHHRFISEFSPGYGWDGMTIALLSANNPIGVLIASLFFGILKNGGSSLELIVGVPRSIVEIIQGLIIFFLALNYLGIKTKIIKKFKKKAEVNNTECCKRVEIPNVKVGGDA